MTSYTTVSQFIDSPHRSAFTRISKIRPCVHQDFHHRSAVIEDAIHSVEDGRVSSDAFCILIGSGIYVSAILEKDSRATDELNSAQMCRADTPRQDVKAHGELTSCSRFRSVWSRVCEVPHRHREESLRSSGSPSRGARI